MAITRINLDSEVSRLIHFPRFEDAPLYTRVPNCTEGYLDASEELNNKSDAWISKSKITYNSPNNIKRLFITSEGVNTHLYQPIAYNGRGSGNSSLMRERKYSKFNATEAYQSIMAGSRDYVVTRSGLGALAHPWVASNIEEVYFDWTVLMSEDVLNMGLGNLLVGLTTAKTNKIEKSDIPYKIFENFCLKGESISNKFPRLKVIGYIQQLARVYDLIGYKKGSDTILDICNLWCFDPVVKTAGADPNCTILIYNIPNVPKLNTTYRLRDGIYLYDKEVLKDYFESRVAYMKNYITTCKENQNKGIINNTKSDIEVTLDEMYERDGEEFTAKAVRLMFNNANYRRQVYNDMSSVGKERYKNIFK